MDAQEHETKNAYTDLMAYLEPEETVEAVVFGNWGGYEYNEPQSTPVGNWGEYGYDEPQPQPIPNDKKGVILSLDEARPLMLGWRFKNNFGACAACYAVRIWTNKRVVWVTQYDGATTLDSSLRNPAPCHPDIPGDSGRYYDE
jgi:hypothetical protein